MPHRSPAAILAAILLSGAPFAATVRAASAADHLVFDDGDHVHGAFAGFDAAGLRWQLRGTPTPVILAADRLDELAFAAPKAAPADKDAWEIRLVGGDRLRGKLVECGPEKTVLEVVGLGKAECPTRAICALAPVAGETLWEGPGKAGEWRVYEGEAKDFKVDGGALVIHGHGDGATGASVGRSLPLPARYRLDLRIERGREAVSDFSQNFQFHFLAEAARTENPGGYGISLGLDYGTVARGTDGSPEAAFVLPVGRTRELALLVDAGAGTLAILHGGQTLWAGKGALPKGDFLLFPAAGGDEDWKISGLRLSAWNGLDAAMEEKPAEDLLRLQNGDILRGEFLGVAEGRIRFRSALGEMTVTAVRLQSLVLSSKRAQPVKAPGAGAVRVEFGGGDRLTLEAGTLAGGALTGRHAMLGVCAVPQANLERVVFNLGAPFRAKAEEARKAKQKAVEEAALSGGGSCEDAAGEDPAEEDAAPAAPAAE